MKISIITMQNVPNYGSVLQAYATQKFFESFGFDVEFIDYWRVNMLDEENVRRAVFSDCNMKFQKYWGRFTILKSIAYEVLLWKRRKRNTIFRRFVEEYLNTTDKRYVEYSSLVCSYPEADIYCTGGDQVWNSDWNEGVDQSFYLNFLPHNARRISFSSSIGKGELDKKEKKEIKEYLIKYELITVREKSAVELLENMGISALQILDPVFMIDKKQWIKFVEPDENVYDNDYIFVYQLNDNNIFFEYLKLLAQRLSKKIVYLKYTKNKMVDDAICLDMPEVTTFLKLIYHAKYVVTDSFHATAFSILFEKKFQCIFPHKYNTRIKSIFDLLSLSDRIVTEDIDNISSMQNEIDYSTVRNQIEEIRKSNTELFSGLI